jgi:hypothetical protein
LQVNILIFVSKYFDFHKHFQLSVVELSTGDTRATTYNAIIKTDVNMRQSLLDNITSSKAGGGQHDFSGINTQMKSLNISVE